MVRGFVVSVGGGGFDRLLSSSSGRCVLPFSFFTCCLLPASIFWLHRHCVACQAKEFAAKPTTSCLAEACVQASHKVSRTATHFNPKF